MIRTRRRVAVALAALALLSPATPMPAAGATDETAAVVAVLDREAAAYRKGDMPGVAACWETEPGSTVFESGYANWGWVDYRDNHLAKELAGMKVERLERTNLKVTASGEMALALFGFRMSGTYEGKTFDATGLETAVLRRRDGVWRIIHVHTSARPSRKG